MVTTTTTTTAVIELKEIGTLVEGYQSEYNQILNLLSVASFHNPLLYGEFFRKHAEELNQITTTDEEDLDPEFISGWIDYLLYYSGLFSTPPYTFLGYHEWGDGSIGVWPDYQAMQQDGVKILENEEITALLDGELTMEDDVEYVTSTDYDVLVDAKRREVVWRI
jgi:hypothetical protein